MSSKVVSRSVETSVGALRVAAELVLFVGYGLLQFSYKAKPRDGCLPSVYPEEMTHPRRPRRRESLEGSKAAQGEPDSGRS
jgi:hypothetical protein